VAALVLSGCGSSKHAALTRYVHQVNAVSSGLQVQLGQVAAANLRFNSRANFTLLRPQLAKARQTLRTYSERLSALQPPPEAKQLAATLGKLVALERSLVDEMYRFTVFLPEYRDALVPVARVSAAFKAAAHAAKTVAAQTAAVEAYGDGLAAPVAALAKLRPPAVLGPTYASELHTLRASRQTALALVAALRARRAQRAYALDVRLAKIGVSSGSVVTQRAEIAAVRAYDAKVARVSRLQTAAERELLRLQQS
jgi:hypothetical protein